MSYAAKQDLIDRYGQEELALLTDRVNAPADTIDDTVVAKALDDATSEINGYIAVRMTTPVTPVPRILVQMTCQIARYRLWKDRASEKVAQDYKDAVAWAGKVGAGLIALGDTASPTIAPSQGSPQVQAPQRQFTRESLRGY